MAIIVLGGMNEDVVAHAGGKGLDQAVAAARQGGTVRMMGAVGADSAGATLRDLTTREGIDTGNVAISWSNRLARR